jgi:hypothetical protein
MSGRIRPVSQNGRESLWKARTYMTNLDIHLASELINPNLEGKLLGLGFTRDAFIGGVKSIFKEHHFSKHPLTRDLFVQSWKEVIELLSITSETDFYGYAEAEIAPAHRSALIEWKPFNPSIPFPFARLEQKECPAGKWKQFDFHITANISTLDARLKHLLEDEINFYYVDILKSSGKTKRVYTFQPMGIKESPNPHYRILLDYFRKAGGIEGKIQLEATYAFARFPAHASVPPIVTELPPIMGNGIQNKP